MKRLYFVRHGLSEMNVAGLYAGRIETPLTDEGRAQAKAVGKDMQKLGIDAIVSSPLERAIETARIIAREIGFPPQDIKIDHRFVERNFGSMEGKPHDPELDTDAIPGVETFDDMLERAKLAMRWLETLDAHNILIVSHGSFGRAMRHLHLPEIDHKTKIGNVEVIQLL